MITESVSDVEETFDSIIESLDPIEEVSTEVSSEPVEEPVVNSHTIPVFKEINIYEDSSSRFSGAPWFKLMSEQEVTIIGQGGIGSFCNLSIARLGVKAITVFDSDSVEAVNMAGQLFGRSDINEFKVRAGYRRILDFCPSACVNCFSRQFTSSDACTPITIGAVDNMEARKAIFNAWVTHHGSDPKALFIDGRLSADELQVFAIPGEDFERIHIYASKWLFPQSEGERTVCSFKQTTFMSMLIAGMIANLVVNHVANQADENNIYDIPFFNNYSSDSMLFKTLNL